MPVDCPVLFSAMPCAATGKQWTVVPDERFSGPFQQHQGGSEPAGLRALLSAVTPAPAPMSPSLFSLACSVGMVERSAGGNEQPSSRPCGRGGGVSTGKCSSRPHQLAPRSSPRLWGGQADSTCLLHTEVTLNRNVKVTCSFLLCPQMSCVVSGRRLADAPSSLGREGACQRVEVAAGHLLVGSVVTNLEVGGRGDQRHVCCFVAVLNLGTVTEGSLWLSGKARI